jgi:hypothetical protein
MVPKISDVRHSSLGVYPFVYLRIVRGIGSSSPHGEKGVGLLDMERG